MNENNTDAADAGEPESTAELLDRAASELRSLETKVYHEFETKSSPPIEESEAYELAEELEDIARSMQADESK